MNDEFLTKLGKTLKSDEGLNLYPYKDIFGNLTIGYGHNLSGKGVSKNAADFIFNEDVQECINDLEKLSFWNELGDDRKIVMVCLCFNLGYAGLMQFRNLLNALENKDYESAAREILNSKAAKQLPARYEKMAYFMETGII